jgi:hypothetical protein
MTSSAMIRAQHGLPPRQVLIGWHEVILAKCLALESYLDIVHWATMHSLHAPMPSFAREAQGAAPRHCGRGGSDHRFTSASLSTASLA